MRLTDGFVEPADHSDHWPTEDAIPRPDSELSGCHLDELLAGGWMGRCQNVPCLVPRALVPGQSHQTPCRIRSEAQGMLHGVVGEPISRLPFVEILQNQDIGYSRLCARPIEVRRARDKRRQTASLHLLQESGCNARTNFSLLATRIERSCLRHRSCDSAVHVNVIEED